jgi:membrane protein implicated in regulation of membrane protease activity
MFALGLTGAAVCAHAGLGASTQIVTAAMLGGGAVFIWHWIRSKRALTTNEGDQNVHLDVGSQVEVTEWLRMGAESSARVAYRGSLWDAKPDSHQTPIIGLHRIVAIEGNTLMLHKIS